MSKYGLDLDKIEFQFNQVLAKDDDKEIADFAKEVIPLLLKDMRKTRIEVMEILLKR